MKVLRQNSDGSVLFPYTDSASHTLEALDRMVDLPIIFPTAFMLRKVGRVVNNLPWIVGEKNLDNFSTQQKPIQVGKKSSKI